MRRRDPRRRFRQVAEQRADTMKLQTLDGDGVGTFFFLPSPARHRRTHVRDLAADRTDSTSTPSAKACARPPAVPTPWSRSCSDPSGSCVAEPSAPSSDLSGPVSGIASSSASGARERCAAHRGATSSLEASHAFENAPSTPSGTRATTHARGPTSGVGGHGASPPPNGRGSDEPICDAAVLETPSSLPVREQTSLPCLDATSRDDTPIGRSFVLHSRRRRGRRGRAPSSCTRASPRRT